MVAWFWRSPRVFLAVLLLALAALACNFSAAPPPQSAAPQPTGEPVEVAPQSAGEEPAPPPPPAILEARRLDLEWPAAIRAGDSDVVRLSLEMDEGGDLQATAEFPGHDLRSEIVGIPDLYDTHTVFAEARLELAGVEVAPGDVVRQPLQRGKQVTFYWSVHPPEVGTYRGAVWFTLRFIPLDGGPEIEHPVTVQPLEIRSVNLLGLSGTPARLLGGVGALLGSLLGLDNVIPWVWKGFRRRKREA
jgi:hypothetical protein